MREVTGSSPVVPTKKMSAMVGALFLCDKDENLQPPKELELTRSSYRLSVRAAAACEECLLAEAFRSRDARGRQPEVG